MNRITPIVRNLLIINVAIFLSGMLVPQWRGMIEGYLSLWNLQTQNFRPYQLFTYMFVHASIGHIFGNMLGLFFLGPILESYWGSMRFLTFYILVGIGAGLFNIVVDLYTGPGSFALMMGASGAVYGILTAFGVLFPNMELMLLFPPIPIKAKYLVLIFGIIALYSGFNRAAGDNTAHFAHLGGIFVALILIPFWRARA